ncbi:MAG TPA: MFS transporter [Candidatus Limnocylindrales bacterium]|nr:MFS transporter [Candidatus Limnocylindrales bacterium]
MDRNGRIVVFARALRSFGFGLNSVALGLYLAQLGVPGTTVGLIISAAFAGSLALTVVIAGWGDRIGRRRLLMAGSALMATAALIPFVSREPLLLAVIALSGMVAVNANESTGLQTVDQALLPQSVPDGQRTSAFALYNLLASAGAALGSLAVGLLPFLGAALGLTGAHIFVPAFAVYAAIGLITLALHARLDARAESGERLEGRLAIDKSRGVVARLSALFGLDSFASSLSVQSYIAYFLVARFAFEPQTAGVLFFVAGVLTTLSFPVAAWLSTRIGLIHTMVFTHIPSSVFLLGLALATDVWVAAAFLLGRAALASMDVPARQSYTMAVVEPRERTATAGVTSLARAIAQVPGPAIAGALLVPIGLGVPLMATAALKITYDLLLFRLFKSRPAPEEPARQRDASA